MIEHALEIVAELVQRTAAVAVAALLAGGLLWLLKPASARVHRLLWCLVLLQGWLVWQYQLPIPWYEAPWVTGITSAEVAAEAPVVELNVDDADAAVESSPGEAPSRLGELDLAVADEVSTERSPAVAPVVQSPPAESFPWKSHWPAITVGIWIIGMLLVAARWLFGYVRFVRRLPQAELADEALQLRWLELLRQRGVRQPIELRMTESLGPMLCRLPRGYALLLPRPFWQGLAEWEQRIVLEHELAHYLRSDIWKSLAVRLLGLPQWFNPAAWWSVRRFDQAAEWACDETARRLDPEQRISYAKTLLRLVEQPAVQSCRSALSGSSVLVRVKRLLSPQPAEDRTMKKLVVLCLVLLLAAFSLIRPHLVAQTPPPESGNGPARVDIPIDIPKESESEVVRLPETLAVAQAKPGVPREQLRYDGKSFDEWRQLLRTELKPERRVEALKAFGFFGKHGYSEEAAEAIVGVTRDYEFEALYQKDDEIGGLQHAAIRAFRMAASPAAMKVLSEELNSGQKNRQRFAQWVLTYRAADPFVNEQEFDKQAKRVVPALLNLIADEEVESSVRTIAIHEIQQRDPQVEGFSSRLRKLMNDENPAVANAACSALVSVDPEAEGLVERLVQLAGNREQRYSALTSLKNLGSKAEAAIPALIKMLSEDPTPRTKGSRFADTSFVIPSQERTEAPENALEAIGPEAIPALLEAYKKTKETETAENIRTRGRILETFRKMGPAAREVIPILVKDYVENGDRRAGSQSLRAAIEQALKIIVIDPYERKEVFDRFSRIREQEEKAKERAKQSQKEERKPRN